MRNFRNHTIVNVAPVGNSICVAGRTMARSLRAIPVRLYTQNAQRQSARGQYPCAQSLRCATSLRWEKSDRTSDQEQNQFLVRSGFQVAG